MTLEDRFWAKVNKTDTCWLWTAGVTYDKRSPEHRYGVIGRGGRGQGNIRAHILSYQLHKGEIVQGLVVRHTCDNTLCVNPEHLILGTQADNVRDMVERGRFRNQNTDKMTCDSGHSLQDAYVSPKTGKRRCKSCVKVSNAKRVYKGGKYVGRV